MASAPFLIGTVFLRIGAACSSGTEYCVLPMMLGHAVIGPSSEISHPKPMKHISICKIRVLQHLAEKIKSCEAR